MTQIVCHITPRDKGPTAISAQIDPTSAKRALLACWETKTHPLTCTVVLLSSLNRVLLLFTPRELNLHCILYNGFVEALGQVTARDTSAEEDVICRHSFFCPAYPRRLFLVFYWFCVLVDILAVPHGECFTPAGHARSRPTSVIRLLPSPPALRGDKSALAS